MSGYSRNRSSSKASRKNLVRRPQIFQKILFTNQTVWLTFDQDPNGSLWLKTCLYLAMYRFFSEWSCHLFNARLLTEWYARMERRFEFRRYDDFDMLERKIGMQNRTLVGSRSSKSYERPFSWGKWYMRVSNRKNISKPRKYIRSMWKDETCNKDKINWKSMTEKIVL